MKSIWASWYHFTASRVIITVTKSKTVQCDVYNKMDGPHGHPVIYKSRLYLGERGHVLRLLASSLHASDPLRPQIRISHSHNCQSVERIFSSAMMSCASVSYKPCALTKQKKYDTKKELGKPSIQHCQGHCLVHCLLYIEISPLEFTGPVQTGQQPKQRAFLPFFSL